MPRTRTLDEVLTRLRKRARAAGPESEATFDALDEHYAGVAAALEQLRSRQGLTQREVATRSGLDQSEVSRILSGRSEPRVRTAQRVARALGAELRVVPIASSRVGRAHKRAPSSSRRRRAPKG